MNLLLIFFLVNQPGVPVFKFHTETRSSISHKLIQAEDWLWFRESNRLERRTLDGQKITIWNRDPRGDLSIQTLLKGYLVTYLTADLRALDRYPNWEMQASLLPRPDLLSKLENKGPITHQNRQGTHYEGVLDETRLVLYYSQEYNLPLHLEIHQGGRVKTTDLVELQEGAAITWQKTDPTQFREMEFSDLGDNEWLHVDHPEPEDHDPSSKPER